MVHEQLSLRTFTTVTPPTAHNTAPITHVVRSPTAIELNVLHPNAPITAPLGVDETFIHCMLCNGLREPICREVVQLHMHTSSGVVSSRKGAENLHAKCQW